MTGTELATYTFPATGHGIRVVMQSGEPWFYLADVCAALEIGQPRNVLSALDEDEHSRCVAADSDNSDEGTLIDIISEAGLFSMILRSRKPDAKVFKRWVTHDVLPEIRKTGSYGVQPQLPQTFAEALELAAAQARELEVVNAALTEALPKAESWDVLGTANGDLSVADAAKILSRDDNIKLGQQRLFTLLGEWSWIYRQTADTRWRVMQTAVETGRLMELPGSHYHPRTGELVLDAPQVRVTVKGLHEIHRRLGGTPKPNFTQLELTATE